MSTETVDELRRFIKIRNDQTPLTLLLVKAANDIKSYEAEREAMRKQIVDLTDQLERQKKG